MDNFINRKLAIAINEAMKYYPVITVTGPRQSGKTTLLRHIFSDMTYYSLENIDIRSMATNDPRAFLASGNKHGMILDEIQNVPMLLSYIQGIADENPDRKFILSGSSNFSMIKSVNQSLAGRTAVFELLPLSQDELNGTTDVDTLLFNGMYPSVWSRGMKPGMMYHNYVMTYLERDVRDLLMVKDLSVFQKFIRLCAARIGSVFNASELSNELGISVNTVKSWLWVLEASYLVIMLQPFYENTRKRLTKSGKLYFTDTGLACYLLGIESAAQLRRDKMRGALFENFIVTEALKNRLNNGKDNNLCFYRDSNMNEVDLLLKHEGKLTAVEIKSAETYHTDFEKGIKRFKNYFPDHVSRSAVVYTGNIEMPEREIGIINYAHFSQLLQQ